MSVAGLVVGVAGATQDRSALLTAGIAGVLAGALSMGVGEYVSVSTQRDSERAMLAGERAELDAEPERELLELAHLVQAKGVSAELSHLVAAQLTETDALRAHATAELGLDPDQLVSPWAAATSSIAAFTLGALLPLLAMVLPPSGYRLWVTVVTVLVALAATGCISASLGGSGRRRAALRVTAGGAIAMAVTYAIGTLVGAVLP